MKNEALLMSFLYMYKYTRFWFQVCIFAFPYNLVKCLLQLTFLVYIMKSSQPWTNPIRRYLYTPLPLELSDSTRKQAWVVWSCTNNENEINKEHTHRWHCGMENEDDYNYDGRNNWMYNRYDYSKVTTSRGSKRILKLNIRQMVALPFPTSPRLELL